MNKSLFLISILFLPIELLSQELSYVRGNVKDSIDCELKLIDFLYFERNSFSVVDSIVNAYILKAKKKLYCDNKPNEALAIIETANNYLKPESSNNINKQEVFHILILEVKLDISLYLGDTLTARKKSDEIIRNHTINDVFDLIYVSEFYYKTGLYNKALETLSFTAEEERNIYPRNLKRIKEMRNKCKNKLRE
ncbi:MAG: hypothetical protein COC01_02225 [Bacteroidetes bacterium]|nr:MAG: hypothetical protein COC01_02225 [Bacteroidota bacterium]